jgi:predicted transcriptional regulator of viral defense system
MSGLALTVGIETHTIEGTLVRIFNPAKTIVDCFKYRHKIGLDVALEALRESWESRRCSMDELWEYSKICRMTKVMRPYLEYLFDRLKIDVLTAPLIRTDMQILLGRSHRGMTQRLLQQSQITPSL